MAKFITGSATIDKFLQIKKADEGFYKYVGEERFASLIKSAHPNDLARLTKAVEELKDMGHNIIAYRIKREDGRYRWILAELEYEPIELSGEPLINVSIQDINALEREMNEIKSVNSEYSEYFGLIDELMFIYNIDEDDFRVFMGGNKQVVNLFRGTLDRWIEEEIQNDYVDDSYKSSFSKFCFDLKNGTRSFKHEIMSSEFSVNSARELQLIKGKTLLNSSRQRKVIGCISVISEDTKKKEFSYNVESNKDAGLDVLNKKAITNYAKKAIAFQPNHSIHLCIIDLDNFKSVNDTYGHMYGDEVLVTVSEILKEAVGNRGVVGRIGGDELFVVLEQVNMYSELRGILRTIRSNVEWAYKGKTDGPSITCSMGIASYPEHGKTYEELFEIADKMLYRAKQKGKNRYIIYIPELHGDAVKADNSEADKKRVSDLRNNKQGLVMKMIDLFLHKQRITHEQLMNEVMEAFDLTRICLYFERLNEPFICVQGNEKIKDNSLGFVEHDEFYKLFNVNNIAVIDHTAIIEDQYPCAYRHLIDNNQTACLVYRMKDAEERPGYVIFYKRSTSSRKWADSDVSYLNIIGQILEIGIGDR